MNNSSGLRQVFSHAAREIVLFLWSLIQIILAHWIYVVIFLAIIVIVIMVQNKRN